MSTRAAILVDLTVHAFVNEISDKIIAAEIAEKHKANSNAGRYLKVRLPPEVLKPIRRILDQARQYHYRVTAPWLDRGVRMLPAALLLDYQNDMTQYKGELAVAVEDLCKDLPRIDAEAKRTRGTLYSKNLIPSEETLKDCWGLEIGFLPVPMAEDFRIDFLENKFIEKFEEDNQERLNSQAEHAKQLMMAPLIRIEECLIKGSGVRESTVDQLQWACKHAGAIAIDKKLTVQLENFAQQIEEKILAYFNPKARPKFGDEAVEGTYEILKEIRKAFDA